MTANTKKEYTGSSVSYYRVYVPKPTSLDLPAYYAECNDIIKALKMNFAEGNAFKAIWRSCAARNLGLSKEGYKDGLYDAEKVVFFGNDMIQQAKEEATEKITILAWYENKPRKADWLWARTVELGKVAIGRHVIDRLPRGQYDMYEVKLTPRDILHGNSSYHSGS